MKTVVRKEEGGLNLSGKAYLVRLFLQFLIQGVLFFLAAGSLFIPRAYLYFTIIFIITLIGALFLIKYNRELLEERAVHRENTESWDKILLGIYVVTSFYLLNLLAGLDIGRLDLAKPGIIFFIPATIVYTAASLLGIWAMVTNRHFEATVRIQEERGHHVVSSGPYKLVRHPGYLSIILAVLSAPLMIGSYLAYIASVTVILVILLRTHLEDKMLQAKLAGYTDYAKKVKHRIIPGIW